MVRNYKRIKVHPDPRPEVMNRAIAAVKDGMKIEFSALTRDESQFKYNTQVRFATIHLTFLNRLKD